MSERSVQAAYEHPDEPGEGAKKRRRLHLSDKEKVRVVMGEFKRGTLRSGSGEKVKSREQAVAIAMSEQRKAKREAVRRVRRERGS